MGPTGFGRLLVSVWRALHSVWRGILAALGIPRTLFKLPAKTYGLGVDPTIVVVGDFNGDGHLDLAVANTGDVDDNPGNTVSVLLGNGDGTFQTQLTYQVESGPGPVVAGDFNGDGQLDLAVANTNDGTVSVLLGNGDGTFQPQRTYTTDPGPLLIAVGDFNGDGCPDLATSTNGTVSILLNNCDTTGTFQPQQTYTTGSQPLGVAVGDLNGDGHPDLAVTDRALNTVSVLLAVP